MSFSVAPCRIPTKLKHPRPRPPPPPRPHTLHPTPTTAPVTFSARSTQLPPPPRRYRPLHPRVRPPQQPVVSAAASVEKPSSSAIRSQKPASGVPRSGTAAGAGGTEPAAREERPTPQAALTAAKVAERNEVEEEEEDKKPLAVRESGGGAAEEVHEQEAGVPPTEGEGSMGKGEEQAAAGADAITVAEEVNDTAAGSGGDGGADGGELPETVVAAASSSATRAPSQAGKEAETMHEGRDSEEDGSRAGAKDPHAADRKSGGEHNQAEAEGSASGEDRTGGEVRREKPKPRQLESRFHSVRLQCFSKLLEHCVHGWPSLLLLAIDGRQSEYLGGSSKHVDI